MRIRHRDSFITIQTEGALLPSDLLTRISRGDEAIGGLKPGDYHLTAGEKLNEAINRSWNRLQGCWASFRSSTAKLGQTELGTTETRERWLLPLFEELKYGRLLTQKAVQIEGKSYAISHGWHRTPIHLVSFRVELDRRQAGVAGAARSSAHSLLQEYLNRSGESLWGLVSNGLKLRILRDNLSLTRQAYVEFDLEAMMEGEVYSDFVLLWLLAHQSRVEAEQPEDCWLERWSSLAHEQGARALDQLRDGVQSSIETLGTGFLSHPSNWVLREKLKSGVLAREDYYRQLLRMIYRLLFLFVAEDRDLLRSPEADPDQRERYRRFYSMVQLRRLAQELRGGRHDDLFRRVRLVMSSLTLGCPELGLPGLGSFLFSEKAVPDLIQCEITNRDLLEAVRALAFTLDGGILRSVDYKNLGSEEFGSVYESLLELHPEINTDSGAFELRTAGGHERKTTGSYYTPTSLVTALLDSALDPVLEEAAAGPDPEKAILDLKVCDPAAGSGHFLIAAAHRIARRLASVRTGDAEPAPQAVRTALRDVISHCIYGVDLNPMAVELCKVALWMESIDPGKPLSFLDHKIQCGNSLLGTTPRLIAGGIPDDAFKPVEGDDKDFTSALRRRNKAEHRGQSAFWGTLAAESLKTYGDLTDRFRGLDRLEEQTVDAVAEKEEKYRRLSESPDYRHARLVADAWCAAFLWRKTKNAPEAMTQDVFRRLQSDPGKIASEIRQEIIRLAEKERLFHWHSAFPEVFRIPEAGEQPENEQAGWNGGFDVVLGNPPWERIKLQEQEWFASRNPDIAQAPNAAARRRKIDRLAEDDPALYDAFLEARRQSEAESHLVRNSRRYPLCGRGDINTYAIFAETNRDLIARNGRAGFIIQSDIATGDTYKYFFSDLLHQRRLISFYDFVNTEALFPHVHRTHPHFCLITIAGSKVVAPSDFSFWNTNTRMLAEPARHFNLTADDLKLLNPNTRTCPIFRTNRDAYLTKGIHRVIPVLINETAPIRNSWGLEIRQGLFHLTNDTSKGLIKDAGASVIHGIESLLPIYEAKLIWQFNSQFATYKQVGDYAVDPNPIHFPAGETASAMFSPKGIKGRYMVAREVFESRVPRGYKNKWFLVYRDITNSTNERTVIATIIPFLPVAYTLRVVTAFTVKPARLCGLLANLNSFVLDFVARQSLAGTHMSDYIVKQLPILSPDVFGGRCPWDYSVSLESWICSRVGELIYSFSGPADFAQDCGLNRKHSLCGEEECFIIRCEIDAAYFHLYGIFREDVDYILETFPIVKRNDEHQFGRYRTKQRILEIYDRMQSALTTGEPFQSVLDFAFTHAPALHAASVLDFRDLDALPTTIPSLDQGTEAAVVVLALLHASGGTIPQIDLARAFALRSQPEVLRKLAPPDLARITDKWIGRIGQRSVAPGRLAAAISSLAERRGIKREIDQLSRSVVTTSELTPAEESIHAWFRFEAWLALQVLASIPNQRFQDVDAGIQGSDREFLEGAA